MWNNEWKLLFICKYICHPSVSISKAKFIENMQSRYSHAFLVFKVRPEYHAKLPPGIAYLFRYRNLNKFITSMLSKFRLFCFLNVYNNTQFSLLYHLKFWKNTILFFFLRENIDSVSFWHFLETCGNFRSKIWL